MKRRDMLKKTAAGAAAISFGAPYIHAQEVIPRKPLPVDHSMEYRALGKSGIKVSRLGFGSHLSEENRKDERHRDRQIQEGYENGINLFDIYDHGGYHQFEPMSQSLAGKRKDVVISLVSVQDDTRKEIEETLKTFHTDYIDLYRIVYRDRGGAYEKGDDVLELMLRMKEEGKIRAVGVVSHRESGLVYAATNFPIDYVMMPVNFHHNKAWFDDEPDGYGMIMPLCRANGIGVLAIKPMGGDPMAAYAQHIGLLAPDYRGPSYPKAAFRYLWQNDEISSVLPSINSVGQLWDAFDSFWRPDFTKEDKDVLKKLSKRADRTFGAYLPEHYRWMEEWRIRTV